jgi:DNA-binding MarR family transcriptional regulator
MAARVVNRHYDRVLAPSGLRTTAYAILARVAREGPLPLGRLAGRLALDRTTLSRELRPLVASGLVAYATDPADARRRVVTLTEAGEAAVGRARPLWERAQRELVDGFGDGRTAALTSELHALVSAG